MRNLATLALTVLFSSVAWAEPVKVWVGPFAEANDAAKPDWINRALQQALSDQLAGSQSVDVVAMPASTAEADAALAQQAKTLGARYVVSGTVQRVNGELRVTGRVQDTQSNSSVGGFKATGSERELFAMEDSIAEQVKKLVAPADVTPVATAVAPATTTATTPAVATAQQPRIETPFAPARYGSFEGSDLQRSMNTQTPIYREHVVYVPYDSTPGYSTPTYPYTVGLGGNYPPYYGGYGYGYGWGYGGGVTSVVVINGHDGHHHGGNGGGGNVITPGSGGASVVAAQSQAIRNASSFAGHPPTGVVMTMGK